MLQISWFRICGRSQSSCCLTKAVLPLAQLGLFAPLTVVVAWDCFHGQPPRSTPPPTELNNHRMSFTVFLGNLPAWVTADDIKGWLSAENLVADAIKVIRNPETQESKGFAFIDAPNAEEMNSIIRRFDRAPLEDRLLRANPAQPPKPKGTTRPDERGPGRGPE